MGKVVVVGSFNQDLVFEAARAPGPGETVLGRFRAGPGGKGFNQAVAAARAGADVHFAACIGKDDAGAQAKALASQEGIQGCWQEDAQQPTGCAGIIVDDDGENRIVVAPGANAGLKARFVAQTVREAAPTVVLVQLEVPVATAVSALNAAREVGAIAILNPAPAPDGGAAELLDAADLVTPNRSELDALSGLTDSGLADQCKALGAAAAVVTLGSRGVALYQQDAAQPLREYSSHPVSAVDTTGAGDAFNGALAAALSETGLAGLERGLHSAQAAAALCVTRPGAAEAMPNRQEIDDFIRAGSAT